MFEYFVYGGFIVLLILCIALTVLVYLVKKSQDRDITNLQDYIERLEENTKSHINALTAETRGFTLLASYDGRGRLYTPYGVYVIPEGKKSMYESSDVPKRVAYIRMIYDYMEQKNKEQDGMRSPLCDKPIYKEELYHHL